jgi:hypothetical protein
MSERCYQKIVEELEHAAAIVRERPEINRETAARLTKIARERRSARMQACPSAAQKALSQGSALALA